MAAASSSSVAFNGGSAPVARSSSSVTAAGFLRRGGPAALGAGGRGFVGLADAEEREGQLGVGRDTFLGPYFGAPGASANAGTCDLASPGRGDDRVAEEEETQAKVAHFMTMYAVINKETKNRGNTRPCQPQAVDMSWKRRRRGEGAGKSLPRVGEVRDAMRQWVASWSTWPSRREPWSYHARVAVLLPRSHVLGICCDDGDSRRIGHYILRPVSFLGVCRRVRLRMLSRCSR